MQVAIIGTGYVGLVTGVCFAEKGNKVICVDNDAEKIKSLKSKKMPIYEPGLEEIIARNIKEGRLSFSTSVKEAVDFAKIIFVSVGTPPTPEGYADLSYVEAVCREIGTHLKEYHLIVEKSTVPVKTGDKVKAAIARYAKTGIEFDVASNPEFLREGSAINDTLNPDRVVIGVENERSEKLLRELYANFNAPIVKTDIKSAELIKHASNSFLSMKISYINAVSAICELVGADVTEVAKGMGMDKRISPQFLSAGIGYGGFCFPKDLEAFVAISKELGYDFGILKEVQKVNHEARERFIKKIEQELWVLKGKTIAVLGLSFKPNTDDIRESSAIAMIKTLLYKGAIVRTYDPKAIEKAKVVLTHDNLTYCKDLYDAAKGANCLILATEWDEFKNMDLDKIKKHLAHPIIFDGRNVFNPEDMKKRGFTYKSVGR